MMIEMMTYHTIQAQAGMKLMKVMTLMTTMTLTTMVIIMTTTLKKNENNYTTIAVDTPTEDAAPASEDTSLSTGDQKYKAK